MQDGNVRSEPVTGRGTSRRQLLLGTGVIAGGLLLPRIGMSAEDQPAVKLTSASDLHCAYVNRQSGRIEAVKSFIEVNPEIAEGKTARVPYRAPTKNVYVGAASSLFKTDIKRYGIVDIEARNEQLGWFTTLRDSYTPGEYTHHFLLTLVDRELGREQLGDWALGKATAGQKQAALAMLDRIHRGYNGDIIKGDPEKMLQATRYYTGRELLRPVLYAGEPPSVGDLAMADGVGVQVASLEPVLLAQAGASGSVSGDVDIGGELANDVSAAAEGATEGVSASGTAMGSTASVGSGSGGSSSAGDGGSGTGGSSSDDSDSSSSSSSSGGASGGSGI